MSNSINQELLDRAFDVLDECTSHPSGFDTLLARELNEPVPDLEQVRYYVIALEGALAQENFNEMGHFSEDTY